MERNMFTINNKFMTLVLLIALLSLLAAACGVKSGNRRPAREDSDKTGEFHRSPITSKLEELSVDLDKADGTCKATPGDLTSPAAARVRLGVQLVGTSVKENLTKSIEIVGEKKNAKYEISGLTIKSAGGALDIGTSSLALDLQSGSRKNYDFNIGAAGTYDILCDGSKVGTFTATE
jgi:hypothetical protein